MKRLLLLAVSAACALAVGCLPPSSDFQALDTGLKQGQTGWTPDAPQHPAGFSTVVSNRVVDLIWRPGHPNSYLGTTLESDDLGLAVEAGDVLSVSYGLSSSTPDFANAMPAGGAVRLFAYLQDGSSYSPGNRPATAPDCVAVAPQGQQGGVLSCTVGEDGTLGYAGLTYDTSNGGVQGRVRFRELKLNDELILLS